MFIVLFVAHNWALGLVVCFVLPFVSIALKQWQKGRVFAQRLGGALFGFAGLLAVLLIISAPYVGN